MGLIHGFYCFGCCWLLFIILFSLGMSVISMIAVTAVILSERRISFLSQPISHTAGVALVFYGAFIVISQQILPIPKTGEMTMPAEMEMPATGRAPHVR